MAFLLPDEDKWFDPETGEHADLMGLEAFHKDYAVEKTESGYRRHPLPKAVSERRGAPRGQLSANDFRALRGRGMSQADILSMNDKFMLEQMGRDG